MMFSVMESITYVVITVMKARLKVKIILIMYIKLKMLKMPIIRQYNKFSKKNYKKIRGVEVEMVNIIKILRFYGK
jgi:hypothetical protein